MPMVAAGLKAKMKSTIEAGLAKNFPDVSGTAQYGGVSKEMWTKIADAISDIAADIVLEIQTNAQVLPGIPTAGGPTNQSTIAPGQIK